MSDERMSWDALAIELGVTRQSVVTWRKLEGAPSGKDLDEWKAFIEERGLGKKTLAGASLKEEKLRHEIEILKAKLDREKRQVIPVSEVSGLLLHLSTQSRTILYQFLETEAPPKLDGMGAAQMRPFLREMADTICDKMGDLIEEFERR